MKKVFVTFVLILSLAACTMKAVPYQAVNPQDGKAVVYVYRPHSFVNSAETMDLIVNDVEIDSLTNNGYRYAFVEPGDAKIVLNKNVIPFNEYGSIVLKDLKAGQVYYVKADPIPMGGFDMILMDEETGRSEIASAKYYVPQ